MMKQTVCLLFVLAFIAQICAIPDGKADAEAKDKEASEKAIAEGKDKAAEAEAKGKAAADKASAEGKEKANAAAAHAKDAAKDASDAKDKAASAAGNAKDQAEKLAKGVQDHAKNCHKPGASGFPKSPFGDHPASKVLKGAEEVGKRMADKGVKVATDFMHMFGL